MRRYILPVNPFCGMAFLVALIIVAELLVARIVIPAWTYTGKTECAVKSTELEGGSVKLNLDCAGTEASTINSATVVRYIKNPSVPLKCDLWKNGTAVCGD